MSKKRQKTPPPTELQIPATVTTLVNCKPELNGLHDATNVLVFSFTDSSELCNYVIFSDRMMTLLWHKNRCERMGKGDHNSSNAGSAPHGDTGPTVRSRHLSSNGITSPPGFSTVQLRKHRCPNGFSIPWFKRSQDKYTVTDKKDKDMSWQLRSCMVLVILLLTNLINYMDRYTIAGLLIWYVLCLLMGFIQVWYGCHLSLIMLFFCYRYSYCFICVLCCTRLVTIWFILWLICVCVGCCLRTFSLLAMP